MSKPPSQINADSSGRRFRRWLLLLILIPLILVAASLLILSTTWSNRLERAIDRANHLDPGWRLDDIQDNRLPVPPTEQNGILQITTINGILSAGGYGSWSFPGSENKPRELSVLREEMYQSLEGERKFPALLEGEQVRVLTVESERFAKGLALARDLVKIPYGRFPGTYPANFASTNLDPCQKARYVGSMLRYDAILRAHKGDVAGAIHNIEAIFHTGRAVGDEPFLICVLIRMSIDKVAVGAIERTLGLGHATEHEMRDIQAYLSEQAQVPYLLIGVRGERAGFDRLFEGIQNGSLSVSEFNPIIGPAGWSNPLEKVLLLYTRLTIKARRADLLDRMTDAVEVGRLPTEKQQAAFKDWSAKVDNLGTFSVTYLILQPLPTIAEGHIRHLATLRTALVGVAAERYRLANGHWPAALTDLVPRFLDQVPTDPYDGLPLKLKQDDGAFIVYALGADRIDNGGQLDDKPFQPGSDIGFRLFDPAKRRQPPRPGS